jgi:pimeloyl-ACP methyl ester carboxylesterase
MTLKRSRRWLTGHIAIWGIVALGVIGIFTALQRQMIYYPTVAGERAQLDEAARLGLQSWQDENGDLIGWRPAKEGDGDQRILVFHGNAGFALHRQYFVEGFRALGKGWSVYLFEYPGYGARPGSPSEAAIKSSAQEALELLLSRDARPTYLIGESLGSGVASHLAAAFPEQVAGLLLVTPFSSLSDVAAHHFKLLPVRTLLSERYDSMEALSHYRGPVAFLLAGQDEVVPKALGQQLHDYYKGPKWLRVISGAGHNSLPLSSTADWWGEVSAFLLATRFSPESGRPSGRIGSDAIGHNARQPRSSDYNTLKPFKKPRL